MKRSNAAETPALTHRLGSISSYGLALTLLTSAACVGGEGESGEDASVDEGEDEGEGEGAMCDAEVFSPGPAALRRMTSTQYANTVQDLFPGIEMPALTILSDPDAHGFENFAAQQHGSALLIEQYQKAAVSVTEVAMASADSVVDCGADGGSEPLTCGRDFLADFAARAFRRPVPGEDLQPYLLLFEDQLAENGFGVGLQLAMQALLQAPEFLYLFEFDGAAVEDAPGTQALDGYALASRLSYFLWDSMPDAALLAAAANGELGSAEGIEAQARRMLGEDAARRSAVNFHRQWLDFERVDTIALDPETYPSYSEGLPAEMKAGLERRVEHVLFEGSGTLGELLTGTEVWVNDSLAAIYGVDAPAPGQWELRAVDPSQRAGILTDVGWLSSRAHAVRPSPVQRGVFVLERLICSPPAPPPADIDTEPPMGSDEDPLTNRERYEQHVADPSCAACHTSIDGIGMGFEHYDSLGRWRDLDNGFVVDASGELVGTENAGTFDGAVELAGRLADSQTVQDCVAKQYFRYALARNVSLADSCSLDALYDDFTETEGDIQELLVSIVTSDSFRYRPTEDN